MKQKKKIEVKIKALEKGSFEIHIELVEKLIESLFSRDNITIASEIVAIVGGLYGFAKWLKGEKPQNIKTQDNGNIEITNNKGEITFINRNIYNIYNENKNVRDNISKQFSVLEKSEGISGFKFESESISTHILEEDFSAVATKLDTLDNEQKDPIREILENIKS